MRFCRGSGRILAEGLHINVAAGLIETIDSANSHLPLFLTLSPIFPHLENPAPEACWRKLCVAKCKRGATFQSSAKNVTLACNISCRRKFLRLTWLVVKTCTGHLPESGSLQQGESRLTSVIPQEACLAILSRSDAHPGQFFLRAAPTWLSTPFWDLHQVPQAMFHKSSTLDPGLAHFCGISIFKAPQLLLRKAMAHNLTPGHSWTMEIKPTVLGS